MGLAKYSSAVTSFQNALKLEGDNGQHADSLRQGLQTARRLSAEQSLSDTKADPTLVQTSSGYLVRNDPLMQVCVYACMRDTSG